MAIVSSVCDSYLKEIMEGVHVSTDTYKIALYTSSASLGATTIEYGTAGEVIGTGYTAEGQALVGFSTSIDTGVSILDFTTDPVWTTATITARGALIYNSSKTNKAVAVLDFGSDITASGGDFTIQFPLANSTDGLIRIS